VALDCSQHLGRPEVANRHHDRIVRAIVALVVVPQSSRVMRCRSHRSQWSRGDRGAPGMQPDNLLAELERRLVLGTLTLRYDDGPLRSTSAGSKANGPSGRPQWRGELDAVGRESLKEVV